MADRDYSATPLWRKLGIPDDGRFTVVNSQIDVLELLGTLPEGAANVAAEGTEELDVVLGFAMDRDSLATVLDMRHRLRSGGGLWVAWPKKSAPIDCNIDFTMVQTCGLATGMVDNKCCRLDDQWQAMRFVPRRATPR